MRFAAVHKAVTYAIAGMGLWTLSMGAELSLPVLVLLALGFGASWFAEGARIQDPRWSKGWTTAVVAVLGLQVFRGVTGGLSFGLAIEFAAFLTVSRLFNRRTGADHQQIIVLAFLQLIAGTVLTTSIGYAMLFVGFVIFTPWMLALTHLRVEIETHYQAEEEEEDQAAKLERVLASRRIVGAGFLGWTAALSLPLFASTIALFVLFPRVGFGAFRMGQHRGQAVAGFGDDVELGGFGRIRDDPTVVLRVTPNRELGPREVQQMLRLRGTAFDHYDGRRWTRSDAARARMRHVGEYYPVQRGATDDDVRVRIVLESLDEPVLFLPQGTVGLEIPYVGSAGRRHSRKITQGHGLDLRYDAGDGIGLVYEAVMGLSPQDQLLDVGEGEALARYLQLPRGHNAVVQLARRLTAEDETPDAKVRTLLSHLRDSGRYQYTLDQASADGRPPLVSFLLGHRRGHCEYFATSLAILLRSVGVPTRNVTGFVGGEFNPYGNYFSVTQSKAHSWVEALLPGRGWVTLDPTPANESAAYSRSLVQVMREMFDAARTYWLMEVLGYDLRTQLSSLRDLRDWFRGFTGWRGSHGGGRADASESGPSTPDFDRQAGGLAVVVLLGAAAVVFGVWRWRRRRRGPAARTLPVDAVRARRLYLRLERVLARAGQARPPAVTPERHVEALEQAGFGGAPTVRRVTELYVRSRYGGAPLDRRALAEAEREVDALRKAG